MGPWRRSRSPSAGRRFGIALCVTAAVCAASASDVGAVGRDFFGVVPQGNPAVTMKDFNRLEKARVGTLRLAVNWSVVQPTAEGGYRWDLIESEIREAAKAGIEVLPVIAGTPQWVRPEPDLPPIKTKNQRHAFRAFMRALVERFGPRGTFWMGESSRMPIRQWQIWNEPSSPAYWSPRPDASEYARLVKLAEEAIHDVDRRAKIMLAGLFYSPNKPGPRAPNFIRDVFSVAGMRNVVDSVAIHPYSRTLRGIKFQISTFRKALADRGVAYKELYVTELGWASAAGPDGGDGGLIKSKRGQAKMLRGSFNLLLDRRQRWNVAGVQWFALADLPRNHSEPTCTFCWHAGLFTAKRDPKPAWVAFKSFTLR